MLDSPENYDLQTSVSYKKDHPLLELTLNFPISFLLYLDESVRVLYTPLPLSV